MCNIVIISFINLIYFIWSFISFFLIKFHIFLVAVAGLIIYVLGLRDCYEIYDVNLIILIAIFILVIVRF
jgi:hypothetical protein